MKKEYKNRTRFYHTPMINDCWKLYLHLLLYGTIRYTSCTYYISDAMCKKNYNALSNRKLQLLLLSLELCVERNVLAVTLPQNHEIWEKDSQWNAFNAHVQDMLPVSESGNLTQQFWLSFGILFILFFLIHCIII